MGALVCSFAVCSVPIAYCRAAIIVLLYNSLLLQHLFSQHLELSTFIKYASTAAIFISRDVMRCAQDVNYGTSRVRQSCTFQLDQAGQAGVAVRPPRTMQLIRFISNIAV